MGNKCLRCGFADVRALQIDKISGGHRKLKKNYAETYLKLAILPLIDLERHWQILCANCNWIKRYTNNEIRLTDIQPIRK